MMKTRWSFVFLAAVSLTSIAGCPKKAKPEGGATIAKLEDIRDQMCKCTDKVCTDKVNEEYAKWGQDQAKAQSGDKPAPTADDSKKTATVMEDITKCTAKAIAGPGAAPDKPTGSPPTPDKPADPAATPPAGDKPADPAAGSGSAK